MESVEVIKLINLVTDLVIRGLMVRQKIQELSDLTEEQRQELRLGAKEMTKKLLEQL